MTHTYIIAEIGINHNGSLENCLKLIDVASDAGCDAAKLQFFKADNLYPRSAGQLDWKDGDKAYSYNIHEAVKRFELPEEWLDQLLEKSKERGIELLASAFDTEGASYLKKRGFKKIKLSSYSVTNIPLLQHCATEGFSIILSTGASYLHEVKEAVDTVSAHNAQIALLHCSLAYPTKPQDCNLGVITTLKNEFPSLKIGYSDHSEDPATIPFEATMLGARIIEKHITLDKQMEGPDHFFALDPEELKLMVSEIRRAEKLLVTTSAFEPSQLLLGRSDRVPYPHEEYLRNFAFTCLFANRTIAKGEIIRQDDITILRPGKKERGLAPSFYKEFASGKIMALADIQTEDPINYRNSGLGK